MLEKSDSIEPALCWTQKLKGQTWERKKEGGDFPLFPAYTGYQTISYFLTGHRLTRVTFVGALHWKSSARLFVDLVGVQIYKDIYYVKARTK